MNLESEGFLNHQRATLKQMQRAFQLLNSKQNLKIKIAKAKEDKTPLIAPRLLATRAARHNTAAYPAVEAEYKGQLKNPNFFYKFSQSFNLMENFIKAESANDLVIALCNLGKNLETNFQKDSSLEMFRHLKSTEGRIFLKHKIDLILNDTIRVILSNPHFDSSKTEDSRGDDLTKSEGTIATHGDISNNQNASHDPRSYINNSSQKLSSLIELFDAFLVSGLKDSARDLLLGLEKESSERLSFSPLPAIYSSRPFMMLDTVKDPKQSGIDTKNIIDYSNWNSSAEPEINVEKTLQSFTQKYINSGKMNTEPVEKELRPYLNKLIQKLDYKYIYSDSAIQFYLKAIQKGYTEEANSFLNLAIQTRFKASSYSDIFQKFHHNKGEFDKLTNLMKWSLDHKFLSQKDFQRTSLALINEINKLKDAPKKLLELNTKYKLLGSFLDKLAPYFSNKSTAADLIIRNSDESINRSINTLESLTKSLPPNLENLFKLEAFQAKDYEQLNDKEKAASTQSFVEKLHSVTVAEFLKTMVTANKENQLNQTETSPVVKLDSLTPNKENVLNALKQIYINFEINSFDEQNRGLEAGYGDEEEYDDDYYDDEGEEIYSQNYSDSPLGLEQPINFLDEIPALIPEINKILNSSLNDEEIKSLGINLNAVTAKDLGLKSIGSVANEALLEFREKYLKNQSQRLDLDNDFHFEAFNNILLKKLIEIHEAQPNYLRFVLGSQADDFVEHLDDDLRNQNVEIVDAMRLPEIFVNRESIFYKNAPNREADGSFKTISDRESKVVINKLIEFFDAEKTLDDKRELKPESKKALNEIILNLTEEDFASTSIHKIAFMYFSLLESNLKREANILLYKTLEDITNAENSKTNTQRLANILPVLKYAKDKAYVENFQFNGEEFNFNKFNNLIQFSVNVDNIAAQKYFHKDNLYKIADPEISHQEITESLDLLCANKKLSPELKDAYAKALMERLIPKEEYLNNYNDSGNNLVDLMNLARRSKELGLLSKTQFKTLEKHFSKLSKPLESDIEEAFKRLKNLSLDTRFINVDQSPFVTQLESLLDQAFNLENPQLTDRLSLKLRENLASLEINPKNSAASLSLLNCVLSHSHDLENTEHNEKLKLEYGDYLDLPVKPTLKDNEASDLRVIIIAKMDQALQAFEKLLLKSPSLKRENFPHVYESESILAKIGLPLYS